MPRLRRNTPANNVFHVLNRAADKQKLFATPLDYRTFETCIFQAHEKVPACRILAWCIMPNHFHLLLHPTHDTAITAFMRKLTLTHAARWRSFHQSIGHGPVYQGRFKSFIVEDSLHIPWVARYILRNPVRANLVSSATDWPFSSLHHELNSTALANILSRYPTPLPRNFLSRLDTPETADELKAVRTAITRSSPFGSPEWTLRTAKRLGQSQTLRPRGRPQKKRPTSK